MKKATRTKPTITFNINKNMIESYYRRSVKMNNIFKLLISVFVIFFITGCGCKPKEKENPEPKPGEEINEKYHFDYEDVMFDNPTQWPTETFFFTVPAAAENLDDFTSVIFGDNQEKQVATLTIKKMTYAEFKLYTDNLIKSGFSCSRAGYWLPDNEKDLSNNYSQCSANQNEIYIKATWSKDSVSDFNFQMIITNYNQETKE